jgi:hypothetical protein
VVWLPVSSLLSLRGCLVSSSLYVDLWGPDPFVDAHLRELLGPSASPTRRAWQLAEQRVLLDRITVIDREVTDLAMERRWMLGRLQAVHDRLWTVGGRRVRRRPELDVSPVPPAVPGAEPLFGAGLRGTALAVLDRHGPLSLRDLHGYLHRYGYTVGGNRPVQRLGDALGFETRAGRARRLTRGVYATVGVVPGLGDRDPASWNGSAPGDPPGEPVPIDPLVREMPERWQPKAWALPADSDAVDEEWDPELDDDPLHPEVRAVLADYITQRRALARQLWGLRSPRAFDFGPLAGESPTNRRRGDRPKPWQTPTGPTEASEHGQNDTEPPPEHPPTGS